MKGILVDYYCQNKNCVNNKYFCMGGYIEEGEIQIQQYPICLTEHRLTIEGISIHE